MINSKTISIRIKNIIESSGIGRNEIAKKAGVTAASISNWINDKRNPNLIDYIKICEACGVANGVFDEREMNIDVPPEIAEDLTRFNKAIIELHKLCIGKKSPLNIYLEDAESWIPIMREMAKKDPIPYVNNKQSSKVDCLAETSVQYDIPIKDDDAFQFSGDPGIAQLKLIKDNTVSIRKYSRACAGYAGTTEETPEFLPYYVEGNKGDSSISLIEVTGDSMHPLIEDGDTLVVRELSDHPRITSEQHVPLEAFREKVPHGAICILNLDDAGQEVK
ncbi:MAG: helix-turn-helix domain-containing protein, partial [Endozoicomonas sp.]